MKKQISQIFLIIIIFNICILSSFPAISGFFDNTNKNKLSEPIYLKDCSNIFQNDAELPIWQIGNSWIYDIRIKGGFDSNIQFDISVNNLKLEVINDQDELYRLKCTVNSGDITGHILVDLDLYKFDGNLKNTKLDANIRVNKLNLNILNSVIDIDGYIDQAIDIHFISHIWAAYYELNDDNNLTETEFYPIKFPLNRGDQWINELTYLGFYLEEFNLVPSTSIVFNLSKTTFNCIKWDIIKIENNEYDALEITHGNTQNKYWFSPGAGTIVKVDYHDFDLGFGFYLDEFSMNLISTTYDSSSNPPEKPKLSGPVNMNVGESGEFSCKTTDSDGDIIRYIIDWGDETQTKTEFCDSGSEITRSKIWSRKGNYSVKCKVKDKYGKESLWSESILVTIENEKPLTPLIPSGPQNGTIGIPYTYESSSSDPDGHQIKYGWDWNGDDNVDEWSEFIASEESCSVSHVWGEKGDYLIKVKAFDQYGEEGPWSDSLLIHQNNSHPKKPSAPIGPQNGKIGEEYTYSTSSSDPDGHQIKYGWDWNGDDNVDEWSEFTASGESCSLSHVWGEKGDYKIKVKAFDQYGEEGPWSDSLPVEMPKLKTKGNELIHFYNQKIIIFLKTIIENLNIFINYEI